MVACEWYVNVRRLRSSSTHEACRKQETQKLCYPIAANMNINKTGIINRDFEDMEGKKDGKGKVNNERKENICF